MVMKVHQVLQVLLVNLAQLVIQVNAETENLVQKVLTVNLVWLVYQVLQVYPALQAHPVFQVKTLLQCQAVQVQLDEEELPVDQVNAAELETEVIEVLPVKWEHLVNLVFQAVADEPVSQALKVHKVQSVLQVFQVNEVYQETEAHPVKSVGQGDAVHEVNEVQKAQVQQWLIFC